jgi:hypothetical protein
MAGTTGLEPATSAVTGQRSNQLSYVPRVDFDHFDKTYLGIKRLTTFVRCACVQISKLWTHAWPFFRPSGYQMSYRNNRIEFIRFDARSLSCWDKFSLIQIFAHAHSSFSKSAASGKQLPFLAASMD